MSYEEGMGVMDAETLGLPEALGTQRDKIKSSFSSRENRMETLTREELFELPARKLRKKLRCCQPRKTWNRR